MNLVILARVENVPQDRSTSMNVPSILRSSSFVLIGLLLMSAFAFGQVLKGSRPAFNVKLGLWEATMLAQTSGTPPIDTSKMTPEQRARVEAAMQAAKQRAAMPHTSRTCLTKEKLEKTLFQDSDASCKHTVITNSATVYAFKVECTGKRPSSGEWRFEALTPETVKGSGKVTLEGKMASASTMTAKWIAASCGDVK